MAKDTDATRDGQLLARAVVRHAFAIPPFVDLIQRRAHTRSEAESFSQPVSRFAVGGTHAFYQSRSVRKESGNRPRATSDTALTTQARGAPHHVTRDCGADAG